MFDALVVGAGPSGCIAAKRLAEAGCSVALFEKKELPRNKSCSGVLIGRSQAVIEREFGAYPDSVLCQPNSAGGFVLVTESNQEHHFVGKGINIWRREFDYWLTNVAQESGAEIRSGCLLSTYIEKANSIVASFCRNGSNFTAEAQADVVCDGAVGWAKRSNTEPIYTLQTFHRGKIALNQKFFYAFLDPSFSDYDAWINCKDEFIIVGVSGRDRHSLPLFHTKFLGHLIGQYSASLSQAEKCERWLMPSIERNHTLHLEQGRVLYAGEAAGLLNPMGEGISSALISGAHAANALLHEMANGKLTNDGLPHLMSNYRSMLKDEYAYMKLQWQLLGRLSPRFAHLLEPNFD